MSAASSGALVRSSSQLRDQLVLQVENVPLAGRRFTIELFEVQNAAPTKATGTPSSPVRSAPSTPSTLPSSTRASGFRVAARDDVENEYSLFVTRQKAEYLYRAAYPVEAAASEEITSEAMANGILAHINIIGNRQRDVGKLVCREPEPQVEKKTRVLPVSTPPHKQRNPHLPSKRQDQRAVRVQKTSKRTTEAVAQAMRRADPDLSGDDESAGSEVESVSKIDRKGSEASLLHRMAVSDSTTMWKAELETNYEESDHPSLFENDTPIPAQLYALAPGLSPVKRALPERKTKHKDLEERRQKGRHQRILTAHAAQEAPASTRLHSLQARGSYSAVIEEADQDADPDLARRISMTTGSSADKPVSQLRALSAPRSSVGNAYGLKNLSHSDTSEPEQFLRRRTLDSHRSVLSKDQWQDDIPGMGIEITDERPSCQTPPCKLDALLNTARRVMLVNTVGSLPLSTSTSTLVSERRSNRASTSPSLFSAALTASHSSPLLRSPKADKPANDDPGSAASIVQDLTETANADEPQLKDLVVKNSPRPRSKSTRPDQSSLESLSPILPAAIAEPFPKQPDDHLVRHDSTEDVSSPKFPQVEEQMQSIFRPRSNSVGSEGIVRLAPLPSASPRPPVPEFLAPPEPQVIPNATTEGDVDQEHELSPPVPDPEVVLYPPNELLPEKGEELDMHVSEESVDESDTLSFQVIKDGMRTSETIHLPVIGTVIDVEAQEQQQNASDEPLPSSPSLQDIIPPRTARQGCWEETSLPVLLPEKVDGQLFSEAAELDAETPSEDTKHEMQQSSAREGGVEALSDGATPQPSSIEDNGLATQKESGELVDVVETIIPDKNTQMYGNTPQTKEDGGTLEGASSNPLHANNNDQLDQNDVDPSKREDMPDSGDCSSFDINDNAEIVVDESTAANDTLELIDDGVDETRVVCVEETEHEGEPTSVGDPDTHRAEDMESPVNHTELDSASTRSSLASVGDKTRLTDDRDHCGSKLSVLPLDADVRVPDESSTQPAKKSLPCEEYVAVNPDPEDKTSPKEVDPDQDHERAMEDANAETADAHQIIASDTEVGRMEQPRTPDFTPIEANNIIATPSAEPEFPVEALPDLEKPSRVSRKKSSSPRKKSGSTSSTVQAKTTSKGLGSRRRSTVVQVPDAQVVDQPKLKLERRRTSAYMKKDDFLHAVSMIDQNNAVSGRTSPASSKTAAEVPAEQSPAPTLRPNSNLQEASKQQSFQHSKVVQSGTNYHKKWGNWIKNGKNIIEKVGCLQLEELVMADPRNEENLLKLGLRYARWPGTSMPAILLLEQAALLHKNATGTREYWFWLGSAHLDIFMRHRKYLPVARFHLSKSLRAFTSAFAYIESLADPMLLLRYSIVLFWHKGDGNLEKTRDIFHELFSQFVSFCDKVRPNLLFLQFQVLHRLKLYVDAIDCMNKIVTLHESLPHHAAPTGVPVLPSANAMPHFAVYDDADYGLMLMQCQQASGDYVSAAQSLASVLKLKSMQQDATLKDEEYFDLWSSLAEKCFHHEDYALALEYYAIALNFAKQSQVLAAIHYNLGRCFQSLGEDNKCVTEYKRARTANRHVPPLVSLTELSTPYDERFVQLLQKSVVQTIEEVRVELYGRAVRRLQRVFRQSRRNLNIDVDKSTSQAPPIKMPSLSKRRLSIAAARNPPALVKIEDACAKTGVKEEASLPQKAVTVDDNQASRYENNTLDVVERRHESFIARKQAAMEEMADLLTKPQYRGREASPSARPNARSTVATQLRSGFLSPEKDRLDARRKQSMETYRQLGYVSSAMPWIEFWEKLLALAPELFESRQALYGSIARIRGRLPLVSDEVAFCALAESVGNVHDAAEKLHDASYERELTYVCAVVEVSKQLERDFPLEPTQLSLKPPHVSLPTISSPRADTTAVHGSLSPVGAVNSRRLVLPPYSPTQSTAASSSMPKKHVRMNQMLDLHFEEHLQKQEAAIAITEATGGFVHPHQRAEKLMVLQDFRQTNNLLLNSQLAFGSGKAAT